MYTNAINIARHRVESLSHANWFTQRYIYGEVSDLQLCRLSRIQKGLHGFGRVVRAYDYKLYARLWSFASAWASAVTAFGEHAAGLFASQSVTISPGPHKCVKICVKKYVCHADNVYGSSVCRIAFMHTISRPDEHTEEEKTVLIRSAHVLWLSLLRNVTLYMLLHTCNVRTRATRHRRDATTLAKQMFSTARRRARTCSTYSVTRITCKGPGYLYANRRSHTHKSHQVWVIKILSRAWRMAGTRVLGQACCCG